MQNPFQYQRPVPPADMIDREEELATLARLCDAGSLVRLDAPRRFGKTTLLAALFERASRDATVGVLVDLSGVVSVAEVTARIERAYRVLSGPVARTVGPLLAGIAVGVGPLRVELGRRGEASHAERLLRLLDLPQQIARRGLDRVIVAFDEFHEVLKIEGLDGTIRSQVQHHDEYVSYVFAGSEPQLMRRLFGERDRPFWSQAEPVALRRLTAEDVGAFVADRFAATGRDPGAALEPLLVTAAGHPQRAMLLAHRLWEATPHGGTADESTFAAALEETMLRTAESLGAQWRALDASEQRAARAVALSGGQPYRADVLAYVGLKRGTLPGALDRLVGRGVLERVPAGGYRFVDPLFDRWVAGEQRVVAVSDELTITDTPG